MQACRFRRSAMYQQRGFSLSELLVVIAVLAILVTLMLPAAKSLFQRLDDITCRNNLKHIGEAAAMVREVGGKANQLTAANWYVKLGPKVDQYGRLFYCPQGPQPTAISTSGGDGGAAPVPGGTSIESNYVLVRSHHVGGGFAWGYDTFAAAGYPLSDDSPWMLHFSQHQKDTITTTDVYGNANPPRYFGDVQAYWATGGHQPLKDIPYVPDGGASYWGVTFGSRWGASCTSVFMKTEPAGKGVKIWTNWNAIASSGGSCYGALWSAADENCPTSTGTMGLAKDCAFAVAIKHRCYYYGGWGNPPSEPSGRAWCTDEAGNITFSPAQTFLWQGPGPGLLLCGSHSYCYPWTDTCTGCNGADNWIIIGDPVASEPSPPTAGDGGQILYNATNYGINEQAVTRSRGDQILALDYPNVIAKPAEDNWNGPAWDADADGVLDFARHAGRVNIVLVDGSVRQVTPDEIDPQDQAQRTSFWMP